MTQEETEATLTISFSRTISVRQYEPVQAFGAIKFGVSTPPEQIALLADRFDEVATALAAQVSDLADAKAAELRGSAPAPEPAPRKAATAKPASSTWTKGARKQNPIVTIQGREFESWTNRDGLPALTGACDVCGGKAYFNQSTNAKTGVVYSPEQNVESAIKFKGGIFCKDHRDGAPAKRQPVEEDDDTF